MKDDEYLQQQKMFYFLFLWVKTYNIINDFKKPILHMAYRTKYSII
jgi:hypothetical protein